MEPTSPNDELANVPGPAGKSWPAIGPRVYLRLPGFHETCNVAGRPINPETDTRNPRAISAYLKVVAQQPGKAI